MTPGSRIPPFDSRIPEYSGDSGTQECSGWLPETGVPFDPGIRISGWLMEPLVLGESGNSEFRVSPGTRCFGDSENQEFRLTWISVFRVTPWTQSSRWLIEPIVPCHSGNSEFQVTQGTQIYAWIKQSAVPVNPQNPEFGWLREPGLGVNPRWSGHFGIRSSGWFKEVGATCFPRGPCDSVNPEFQATPGTCSCKWIREKGVPGDSGNPQSSGCIRKQEFIWWIREPEIWVTLGTRGSGWLLETRVTGESGNPEFRLTRWTRSSEWHQELGVLCD